ncbi:hypothetical protein K431DRAFT_287093 [Polychaeton citri CBS 116435]|uniref:CTLH domain-containing protein n=1 Tax=Polychaeton citri CBS 116435 TaxID=1314669 RepID=A0A9P4Q660_9PEZI|nr:hypothetical protein K431DRAFT_287093 [Polychaeton citri CBS 116435]
MSSSTISPPATMRPSAAIEAKVEEMKPSKSDINWVIMDYLVTEGYPGAAEKFAQETNMCAPGDIDFVRARVHIRNAIHSGDIQKAIELVNDVDPELLDNDHTLHFHLLQLHLIELIRAVHLSTPSGQLPPVTAFRPALEFATSQLSPRAPTDQKYQRALEHTMALMIFDQDKMTPEFKELLDVNLRERIAGNVNKALLCNRGMRKEAKIRDLLRARAWAEKQAKDVKVDLPAMVPLGLEAESSRGAGSYQPEGNGDIMVS